MAVINLYTEKKIFPVHKQAHYNCHVLGAGQIIGVDFAQLKANVDIKLFDELQSVRLKDKLKKNLLKDVQRETPINNKKNSTSVRF